MIRKYKFTYQGCIKSIAGVILLALWLVILVAFSSLGFIIALFYAVAVAIPILIVMAVVKALDKMGQNGV